LYGTIFIKKSNCRRCGRIFCESCCNYQIKLDENANPNSETGVWCQVCQQCFVARKGFAQTFGNYNNYYKLWFIKILIVIY